MIKVTNLIRISGAILLAVLCCSQVRATIVQGPTEDTTSASLRVSDNLVVEDDTTLGDANTDNVVFNADVNSSILPNTDDTFDLGSSSQRWRDVYVGPSSLHIGTDAEDATLSFVNSRLSFDRPIDAASGLVFSAQTAPSGITDKGIIFFNSVTDTLQVIENNGTATNLLSSGAFTNSSGVISSSGTAASDSLVIGDTSLTTTSGVVIRGDGSLDADGDITLSSSGTVNTTVGADGSAIFNEQGAAVDFRVESDTNPDALVVDGTNNTVAIGRQSFGEASVLQVTDQTNSTAANTIYFNRQRGGTSGGNNGMGTNLLFRSEYANTSDTMQNLAQISSNWRQIGGASGQGQIQFSVSDGTALQSTPEVTISDQGFTAQNEAVFNESGGDNNFRIEGSGEQNLLFVDAGNDRVGIGDSTPATELEVAGTVTSTGLDVNGSSDIGSAGTDTVTITAEVDSNIVPDATNTYDLGGGLDGNQWRDLYLTSDLIFEGSAANSFETVINVTNPTGDNTITFPNNSGTVALTADLTSAGGWTDSGTVVHSTTATDDFVIGGTTSIDADITFFDNGAAVFNGQGQAVDFVVEGDTDANLFYIDGGADDVLIGGATETGADIVFNANGTTIFNQQGAAVDFRIEGDTDENLFYVDGSGDEVLVGGTDGNGADVRIGADAATVFNEQGNATDFRVETDTNPNAFIVDGTNNTVAIGSQSFGEASVLQITDPTNSTTANTIYFNRQRGGSSGGNNGMGTNLLFRSEYANTSDTMQDLAQISSTWRQIGGASGQGQIQFSVSDGTALQTTPEVTISDLGFTVQNEAVFNESGGDNNFRVEGDADTNLLFADASTDRVGIGTNEPNYKLDVEDSDATTNSIKYIAQFSRGTSGTAVNGIGLGMNMLVENANGTLREATNFESTFTDATHLAENSNFDIYTKVGGTTTSIVDINGTGVQPGENSRFDLGTSALRWEDIFAETADFTGAVTAGSFVGDGSGLTNVPAAANAFVNGGNSFGGTATLGTNDTNALAFETDGNTRMTIASGGDITLESGVQILGPDGGASPTYSFSDDPDTGISGSGFVDNMGIITGGNLAIRIDELQNVGIGDIDNPAVRLDVDGDIEVPLDSYIGESDENNYTQTSGGVGVLQSGGSLTFTFDSNGNDTTTFMSFEKDGLNGAGTELMRITDAGVLLPGADSTYDIGASGTEWANLYVDNITFTGTLTGDGSGLTGVGGAWTLNTNDLSPNTSATTNAVIGGTTQGDSDIILNADGSAVFNEQGNAVDFRIESDNLGNLFFADADVDIDGGQNGVLGGIGIGTGTPTARLHVATSNSFNSTVVNALSLERQTNSFSAQIGSGVSMDMIVEDGAGNVDPVTTFTTTLLDTSGTPDTRLSLDTSIGGTVTPIVTLDTNGLSVRNGVMRNLNNSASGIDVKVSSTANSTVLPGLILERQTNTFASQNQVGVGIELRVEDGSNTNTIVEAVELNGRFIDATAGDVDSEFNVLVTTGGTENNEVLTVDGTNGLAISPGILRNKSAASGIEIPTASSANGTVLTALTLERQVTGGFTAANGNGVGMIFEIEDDGDNIEQGGEINVVATNVDAANTASAMNFEIRSGNSNVNVLTLDGTGATVTGAVNATSFAGDGSSITNLNASNVASGTLASARGGTGVSNAGSLTYGANDITFTTTAATNVTLPTSGTLATLADVSGSSGSWTLSTNDLSPNTPTSTNVMIGRSAVGVADQDIALNSDGSAVFNEQGNAVDFRVETAGNSNMLVVDDATDSVGIGDASPSEGTLVVSEGDATTNDVANNLSLIATSTGTAAAGLGSRVSSYIQNAAGQVEERLSLDSALTVATDGSERARLSIRTTDGGTTLTEKFRFENTFFGPQTTGISSGTDANRWDAVYALGSSIHIGPANGESGNNEATIGFTAGSPATLDFAFDGAAAVINFEEDGTILAPTATISGALSSGAFTPIADSTHDIGAVGNEWANLYVDGITAGTLDASGDVTFDGATTIGDAITDAITMTGVVQGTTTAMRFEGGAQAGDILFSMPDPATDITVTFPSVSGTLLSSGNGFIDGGNSFGQAADLGTLDANVLNFVTGTGGPNTRMSIGTTGNITVNAADSGTELAVTGETSSTSFLAAASTSTAPRYSFISKDDTGISATGTTTDLMHFITDGGERMSIHSSGIDIAAASGTELEVSGAISTTTITAAGQGTATPVILFSSDSGIGGLVGGSSDIMSFIVDGVEMATMHSGANNIDFNRATAINNDFDVTGVTTLGDAITDAINMTGVVQGTTTAMRFEGGAQAGDILFSMPDPATNITLTFPNTTDTLATLTDVASASADFNNDGDNAGADRTIGNNDAFDLGIETAGTTRIHVEGNAGGTQGYVGIGTTSPSAPLTVVGDQTNTGALTVNSGNFTLSGGGATLSAITTGSHVIGGGSGSDAALTVRQIASGGFFSPALTVDSTATDPYTNISFDGTTNYRVGVDDTALGGGDFQIASFTTTSADALTNPAITVKSDNRVIINEGQETDQDFSIGGNGLDNLFATDAALNRVGINVTPGTTTATLEITEDGTVGAGDYDGVLHANRATTDTDSATAITDVLFDIGSLTYTTATGTFANQPVMSLSAPNYLADNSLLMTKASTLYIAGEPGAGNNVTISDSLAIDVEAGDVAIEAGQLAIGKLTPTVPLDVVGAGTFTGAVTASSFSGDGSALTNIPTEVANDASPQLGADLDVNGNAITSASGDLAINPTDQLIVTTGVTPTTETDAAMLITKHNAGNNNIKRLLELRNSNSSGAGGNGQGVRIGFGVEGLEGSFGDVGQIDVVKETHTTGLTTMRFNVHPNTALAGPVEFMRIHGDVGLGIGTTGVPGAKLDIRGTVGQPVAIFNEDGANSDFRIEGDTVTDLFFVDASADFIGIGKTPTTTLDVDGTVTATAFVGDGSALTNIPTEVANDASPQLGADLDVNGNSIVSVSNGDIVLAPNGSGAVDITAADIEVDLGQFIGNSSADSIKTVSAQGTAFNSSGHARINLDSLGVFPAGTFQINKDVTDFGAGTNLLTIDQNGLMTPGADNTQDFGSAALSWQDGFFDGTVTAAVFSGSGASLTSATVPLAALAGGTDGQIITWDANGDITAIGPGTSGQALISNGANAAPSFQDIPATAGAVVDEGNSGLGTLVIGTNDSNSLAFETNTATAMTIDTSQNVGMGVTPTTSTLTVLDTSTTNETIDVLTVRANNSVAAGGQDLGAAILFQVEDEGNDIDANFARIIGENNFNTGPTFDNGRLRFQAVNGATGLDDVLAIDNSGITIMSNVATDIREENGGAITIEANNSSDALTTILELEAIRDGANGGNGFGGSLDYMIENSAGAADLMGRMSVVSLGTGQPFDNSEMYFGTVTAGNFTDKVKIDNDGLHLLGNGFTDFDLRFEERSANGDNYVAFRPPASIASDVVWTLPDEDGSANEFLFTNGSGTLAFGPLTGSGANLTDIPVTGLANGTAGQLITWNAAGVATTVATGDTGQVLTSNGAGAAPTFQALGSSVLINGGNTTGNPVVLGSDDDEVLNFETNNTVRGSFGNDSTNGAFSVVNDIISTGGAFRATFNASTNTPLFSFAGDTNTGIYNTGGAGSGNRMRFQTAGTDFLRTTGNDGNNNTTVEFTSFTPSTSTAGELDVTFADAGDNNTSSVIMNGDVTLGSGANDNIGILGRITTDLDPDTATLDLGSDSTNRWRDLFISDQIFIGADANDALIEYDETNSELILDPDNSDSFDEFTVYSDGLIENAIVTSSTAIGVQRAYNVLRANTVGADGAYNNIGTGISYSTPTSETDTTQHIIFALDASLPEASPGQTYARADFNVGIGGTLTRLVELGHDTTVFDTVEGFNFLPIGTGAGDTFETRYRELTVNGTNYSGFKAQDDLTNSQVWTLPDGDGAANTVMFTDGSGNLGFDTLANLGAGGGGDFATNGDTAGADRTIGNNDAFDLGIEANGSTRIHIEGNAGATQGFVGVGTTAPDSELHLFNEVLSGTERLLKLETISSTTPINDLLGTGITFGLENSANEALDFATMDVIVDSITDGSERGRFELALMSGGSVTEQLELDPLEGLKIVPGIITGGAGEVGSGITILRSDPDDDLIRQLTLRRADSDGGGLPGLAGGLAISLETSSQGVFEDAASFDVAYTSTGFNSEEADVTIKGITSGALATHATFNGTGVDVTSGTLTGGGGIEGSGITIEQSDINDTILRPLTIKREDTNGGALSGLGAGFAIQLEDASSADMTVATFDAVFTSTAGGSEDVDIILEGMSNGSLIQFASFDGVGGLNLDQALITGGTGGTSSGITIDRSDTNDTVLDQLRLRRSDTNGGGLGGLGAEMIWQLENATNGVFEEAGSMRVFWNNTAADSEDSEWVLETMVNGSSGERIRVDEAGRIGINESNPASALHVQSSTAAALQIDPFNTAAGNTGEMRFLELAATGTNYVGFKAPDSIGSNQIWDLPAADGAANTVMFTDGAGNLGFDTIANLGGGGGSDTDWTEASPGANDITQTGSGQVFVNVGAVGTPTYTFDSDGNTGIYSPGAETIAIATTGVQRVEFDVTETTFNQDAASTDFRVEGASDANLLFADASTDRVGIGTATPAVKLDSAGAVKVGTSAVACSTTTAGAMRWDGDDMLMCNGSVWVDMITGIENFHVRAFVSSQTYTGNLGGPDGADATCQSLADAQNLGGQWAMLGSHGNRDLKQWLRPNIDIVKSDGTTSVKDGLLYASLDAPINLEEDGSTVATADVWTGTTTGGVVDGTDHCSNWTSSSSGVNGTNGNSGQTGSSWIDDGTAISCDNSLRIYCIEVTAI